MFSAKSACISGVLVFVVSVIVWGSGAAAQTTAPEGPDPLPPIDVSRDAPTARLASEALVSASQQSAVSALAQRIPGLNVRFNALTGTPARVQSTQALLTEGQAQPAPAPSVLRNFLRDNEVLFGLSEADLDTLVDVRSTGVAPNPRLTQAAEANALTHVALEQRWQERQIYPTNLVGSVTGDGRLVSVAGIAAPDVADKINATDPELSPLDAIGVAAESLGAEFDPEVHEPLAPPEGPELRQTFSRGELFDMAIPVRLIYFLASPDEIRLVWEVTAGLREDRYAYQVLVDALDGDILFRETITDEEAPQWRGYFEIDTAPPVDAKDDYRPLDSPRPLSPGPATPDGSQGALVPSALFQTEGDPALSVGGWLAPGVTVTSGNNVISFVDLDDDGVPDPAEQPTASIMDLDGVPTRSFDFPFDPTAAPGTVANRNAATVNAFVVANWWHDRMAELGFTEGAGNFQDVNSTGNGVGGDPILARLHVGTDNSTFGTPAADGTCCPTLNSFTWTGPDPDRDSGFDTEVLIHEFTHGLSNRIIGGPNVRGLGGSGQPRGLGEGYSDLYALMLLRTPDEDPDGIYVVGGYAVFHMNPAVFGQPPDWEDNYYFGIRHFPYTTDLCVNSFTLADMQPASYDITPIPEAGCTGAPPVSPWLATRSGGPHDMGEIWAATVWEGRRNLVDKHGPEIGNELALQLLTDSLFLLDRDPTFIDARDAVLVADLARTGGENRCELWRGFAKRGVGVGAATPEIGAFTEDFAVPEDCVRTEVAGSYSYAAKIVCGVQEDPEDFRLTPGRYATTVNIHNPGPDPARFRKVLALTFPPKEQEPGEVLEIAEHELDPERALASDCDDVRRRVFPDGWPAAYVEGFLIVRSDVSLDVAGVYTKSALEPEAGGVAIDVEAIGERKLADGDGDERADLIPVPDANGQFCRIEDRGLRVTVRNQGAGLAGISETRVDFGSHGEQTAATAALGPGASADVSVPLPAGCFDPDCDFRIRVDAGASVDEESETNNEAFGLCLG